MIDEEVRRWWPFDVGIPFDKQSVEVKTKLAFLHDASDREFRAYVQGGLECGAIADNERECLLVWRGKQRAEMILIDAGKVSSREIFTRRNEGEAFQAASAKALAWLSAK